MDNIPDKSVDMILTDLPYGTTQCKWDSIIPFEPLWEQYNRVIKDNGAILLFSSQPFTSALSFGVMTEESKKYIADALMFSPKCWKDGKFKFDRESCGKNCYECMYETFGSLVR